MEKDEIVAMIKSSIVVQTNTHSFEEAVEWFEEVRKRPKKIKKTPEVFDELISYQLATLFRLLTDIGEIEYEDNKFKIQKS